MRRRSVPPDSEGIQAVFAELSRAQGIGLAGDYEEALAIATRVRERAEGVTDWRPLWLRARADEGNFLNKTGDYAAAERVSTEAYFEAARTGAWDIAAKAALGLIYVVGIKQARHTDGQAWAVTPRLPSPTPAIGAVCGRRAVSATLRSCAEHLGRTPTRECCTSVP
jgi:hypothetical protein